MRVASLVLALNILALGTPAMGSPRHGEKTLLDRYRKKFVVVLRKGLAVGICSSRLGPAGNYGGIAFGFPYLSVTVSDDEAKPETGGNLITMRSLLLSLDSSGCCRVACARCVLG